MIFGFNIITGISDDLAVNILGVIGLKVAQYIYDTPVNNPIRSIGINYSCGQHWLRLNVNASVLVSGKETVDIEFIKEPDFSVLEKNFKISLAEIMGKDNAASLPTLREWGLWIMRYGMDIKVDNINEIMNVFVKTEIPEANLQARNATAMIKPYETYTDRLEIYQKSELIKAGKIEYKGAGNDCRIEENRNVIRLFSMHKKSNMVYAKRVLIKFEMDTWRLDSYLTPFAVTNTLAQAYLDTIGGGAFYKYEAALADIENKVSNFQNRKILTELINTINEKGTVAKARESYSDKKKFKKELKLLRDAGINGALLNPDADFDRIKNPIDEILHNCKIYSS